MIQYEDLIRLRGPERAFRWSERDAMLYALAVGMGQDPLDRRELGYVYESGLKVVPSFAAVAAWGSQIGAAAMQINYLLVVQADQKIEFHRPLAPAGHVIAQPRVAAAFDKGPKGAIIVREVVLRGADDNLPVATLTSSIFARGDGGFGGPSEGAPSPHPIPDRPADVRIDLATRPEQALLYRLAGDRNPLHADPDVAAKAGFDRPILHGLCTYGMACRAVLAAWPDIAPEQVLSHEARFSAPVFPGETISFLLWRDRDTVAFEATVLGRNVAVLRNGRTVLRAT